MTGSSARTCFGQTSTHRPQPLQRSAAISSGSNDVGDVDGGASARGDPAMRAGRRTGWVAMAIEHLQPDGTDTPLVPRVPKVVPQRAGWRNDVTSGPVADRPTPGMLVVEVTT